jgi:hypothetical protein
MNPTQKYGKLYVLRKIEVYVTFNGETHLYVPCIVVRAHTCQNILFIEESNGGIGD